MFAITFDLDTESLREAYHNDSIGNAYKDIRNILVNDFGFTWQQGSTYFGSEEVDAVTCVLAAQALSASLPWFASSIRDIRMLKIEDNNDLMPAIAGKIKKKVSKLRAV